MRKSPDTRWLPLAVRVCVFLLAGAAAVEAGDVEYRVVGVVPFPADERTGAAVDAADRDVQQVPRPAWVHGHFWDELVFDSSETPEYEQRRTRGLTDAQLANLDIYIRTDAPEEGIEPVSDEMLSRWRQAIPEAVRQFTGQPWRGRITSGINPRALVAGQVNVGIGKAEDFSGEDSDTCAFARISYYTYPDGGYADWAHAEILFNPDDGRCIFRRDSEGRTMAHELGHVLGLYHVTDPAALMYRSVGYDRGYTQQLVDHAQLLFELGPGLPYPGFESGAPGTAPDEWTGSVDRVEFDLSRGVITGRAWHDGAGHQIVSERLRVVGLYLDAADDVVDDPRVELRERIDANVRWEFDLPAPEEWDRVALALVVQTEPDELFAIACHDAEDRAARGRLSDGTRLCVYRRSDIEVEGSGPNPRDATRDLADRALEDLQSQAGAAAELNIEGTELALDAREDEAAPVPALPLGAIVLLAGGLALMGWRRRDRIPLREGK